MMIAAWLADPCEKQCDQDQGRQQCADHQHAIGVIAAIGGLHLGKIPVLSGTMAVLSNLVSNVPAVLLIKPFVAPLRTTTRRGW